MMRWAVIGWSIAIGFALGIGDISFVIPGAIVLIILAGASAS